MTSRTSIAAPKARKPTLEVVALCVIGLVVLAHIIVTIHNSSRLTRVARLVGIDSYLPISDSQLDEAAKSEFPVGMTEQEATEKLEQRDVYQHSYYSVISEASEDEESTEYFVVLVSGLEFSLVMKEYLLVLKIDTESHRIRESAVTYGLTGF